MTKATIALIVAILAMTGCGHLPGHTHENEGNGSTTNQNDHIESESVTQFTGYLELFAEFEPLIVGETSMFNVHLTNLNEDYSPLVNADVVLTLEIDGEHKEELKGWTDVPGIYHFEVSPPFSGEGKLIFNISTKTYNDQFILDHIHVFRKVEDVHAHSHGASSGEIFYSKEQSWSTDFNIMQLLPVDFSGVVKASGEIMAMPGEKQNLVAKNDGIVLFAKRNLVQGSPVKKGELVFTISGKGFTDDNISVEYQNAKLHFEKSKNQYNRHKNLVNEKIISESQFLESRNAYLTDSVTYYNFKQTVSDGGLKVHAPLAGYIHELNVSEGQFASKGSLLATISSNKVMLLRADVPQQFFRVLGQINDATFRPAYTEKVYTMEALNGKLLAKASSVAENNHYMPVYFEVINDGTLLEGAFAEFYLKTEPRPGKLVVPVSAIIEEQSYYYVFVQETGETYSKREIKPGDTDGLNVEVLSGLAEGERIVTRGAMLVKAAAVTTAPIHSHSH